MGSRTRGDDLLGILLIISVVCLFGVSILQDQRRIALRESELDITNLVTRDVVQTMTFGRYDPNNCYAIIDPTITTENPFPYPPCPTHMNPIKRLATSCGPVIEYCNPGPRCVAYDREKIHCTAFATHVKCPVDLEHVGWITSCRYGFYVKGHEGDEYYWITTGELKEEHAGYQSHHYRNHTVAYLKNNPKQYFTNGDCFDRYDRPIGVLGNYFNHWRTCDDYFDNYRAPALP